MEFESSEDGRKENLLKVQDMKNVCKLIKMLVASGWIKKTVRSGCKHEAHHTSHRWKSDGSIKQNMGR